MSFYSRRNSLKLVGSAALCTGWSVRSAEPTAFAVEDQRPFREQTRRLKITNQGRYVTALIFSADYPTHFRLKPEFYPVLTPAGYPVTDSHQYCFIHHQSIMSGHGRVRTEDGRVIDFYRKLNFPEAGRSDRWHTKERNLYHLGPSGIQEISDASWTVGEGVRIDLRLNWRTRVPNSADGKSVLTERRQYMISQSGPYTIIDHHTELVPVAGVVVLEADRHSFCGVRVHDMIDVEDGGTMKDAEGRVNPDGNYWDADGNRKAPRWVDCTGKIGAATVGLTLIGHPKNIRNEYYVRDWGLMEVSPVLGHEHTFSKVEPFRFAARYVAHDGEMAADEAARLTDEFAKKPVGPA